MKTFFKGLLATSFVCVSLVGGTGTSYAAPTNEAPIDEAPTDEATPASLRLIDTTTIGNGTIGYLNGATGGSTQICLKDAVGGANVAIYDNDNGSKSTLVKSSGFMANGSCYTFNSNPYVDGTDNDAEFIVETTRDILGTIKFELWN